jgi:hypothetical protein
MLDDIDGYSLHVRHAGGDRTLVKVALWRTSVRSDGRDRIGKKAKVILTRIANVSSKPPSFAKFRVLLVSGAQPPTAS